jgi:hypothetical protein
MSLQILRASRRPLCYTRPVLDKTPIKSFLDLERETMSETPDMIRKRFEKRGKYNKAERWLYTDAVRVSIKKIL